MIIFDIEKKDGLEQKLLDSSKISYASEINIAKPFSVDLPNLELTKASTEDIDLFYIDSVLVSVGWNKNDDIFDHNEVWKARHTPVNKQLNLLHSDNYIVGHITSSAVVSDEKLVKDDILESDIPSNFDIVVGSVIYKKWQDQIKQDTIDKIIAEIKDNKWFVSMECLFPTFDYGLISSSGEQTIVARNEESSFLTKYLARYGGTGKYKDYKIGRVLRNIVFSGKGLVKNPANPRSIIFNEKVSFANASTNTELLKLENNEMSDMEKTLAEFKANYETQIKDLKFQIESTKAEKEAFEKEVQDSVKNKTQAEIDGLNQNISTLKTEVDALKNSIAEKEAEAAKMKKDLQDKEDESKKYAEKASQLEKEIATAKRVSKLVSSGISNEDAIAFVGEWSSMADEQFDKLADLYTKKNAEAGTKQAEANIEQVEEEPGSTATLSVANTDVKEELQTAVAGWFKDKINKKNNK